LLYQHIRVCPAGYISASNKSGVSSYKLGYTSGVFSQEGRLAGVIEQDLPNPAFALKNQGKDAVCLAAVSCGPL
jgi:hypothetical protein